MKVIGFTRNSFVGRDGNNINGINLYVSHPIVNNGEGVSVENIYLSDAKLSRCGYSPKIGDEVQVYFNRYGKVEMIVKN